MKIAFIRTTLILSAILFVASSSASIAEDHAVCVKNCRATFLADQSQCKQDASKRIAKFAGELEKFNNGLPNKLDQKKVKENKSMLSDCLEQTHKQLNTCEQGCPR